MNYFLESMTNEHRMPVIDIFNHFVEHSYAAYLEEKVGYEFFNRLFGISNGYSATVAKNDAGDVVGFAMMHAYHPARAFVRTAELTYFIHPEHTGKGIGRIFLDLFEGEARRLGIDSLIASVSSLNENSLQFHRKCGFEECGRFKKIGRKFGRDFDVVWMQKRI
ncbi:MAG: N-acetyltransferase [Deltaproteobacteria bacterium]|nr:N-acetyltransferase [Deltaproteobacteria bacterium]